MDIAKMLDDLGALRALACARAAENEKDHWFLLASAVLARLQLVRDEVERIGGARPYRGGNALCESSCHAVLL